MTPFRDVPVMFQSQSVFKRQILGLRGRTIDDP